MYKKNNIFYPSVTQIIHQVSKFADSRPGPSAAIGTLIHYHILKRYRSLCAPIAPIWRMDENEVNDRINRALVMWNSLKFDQNVIDVERVFYDDLNMFAGKIDMLVENGDRRRVIEIKTGDFYEEYFLQVAAYVHLSGASDGLMIVLDTNEQRNPDRMAKMIEVDRDKCERYFDDFLELRKKYREQFGI